MAEEIEPSTVPDPQSPAAPGGDLLRPGQRLAQRYEIGQLIGKGGMGAVYRAADLRLKRTVAVKTLAPFGASDPGARSRFEREAQAASAIDHLNIVAVFDYGVDGSLPFIVMEYLRGTDLAQVLAEGPLSVQRATDVALGICAGVFAAHEVGIIHRDLKPQNVFIVPAGAGDIVKVLDFGVSKRSTSVEASLTDQGDVVGTVHYMSPEQAEGRLLDERSDQFSIGVILYRAVVGKTPHPGQTTQAILVNIARAHFPPPREILPDIDHGFETVLLRAMSLRPADRFPSVHHLGRALLPFASERGRRQWTDTFTVDSPNVPVTRAHRPVASERPTVDLRRSQRDESGDERTRPLPVGDARALPPTKTKAAAVLPGAAAAGSGSGLPAETARWAGVTRGWVVAAALVLSGAAVGGAMLLLGDAVGRGRAGPLGLPRAPGAGPSEITAGEATAAAATETNVAKTAAGEKTGMAAPPPAAAGEAAARAPGLPSRDAGAATAQVQELGPRSDAYDPGPPVVAGGEAPERPDQERPSGRPRGTGKSGTGKRRQADPSEGGPIDVKYTPSGVPILR
jgi:eukaryotic-like serine/threonine-protein kinase